MHLSVEQHRLLKRHPLTISRGTITGSTSLVVTVTQDGVEGWGEMSPGAPEATDAARADLDDWAPMLEGCAPWEIQRVEPALRERARSAEAVAAIDMAMHDWIGKRAGMPLWQLWGLDRSRIVPTSVTVGINPPPVVRERVTEILARTGTRVLKVKLGHPDGPDADREMFAAAQEAAAAATGDPVAWRVDANGGWSLDAAVAMTRWLAERGVAYVEQPLPRGAEEDLAPLFTRTALPIYVDESVRVAADVPALADRVHGVNLKLMKTGGLTEALRLVAVARANGLRVMIGCMGETSLSITAGAHLGPLMDHIDLDSHLNIVDDPFAGAVWDAGRVVPTDRPGLGVVRR
jgi:L-alanine-DL-glutamate epimerase-like enolase superfamily enzyme